MLKTTLAAPPFTHSSKETVNPTGNRVGSGGVGGAHGTDSVGGKTKKPSKAKNINGASGKDFLTPKAKFAFTRLRKAFTEVPILHHFDPERHIWIETDASGYEIGGVVS